MRWSASTDKVFGYIRKKGNDELLVLLNMSGESVECTDGEGSVLYSTHPSVEWTEKGIALEPHQGVIIRRDR